jgi:two-component system chemotaxis sensor kinase CheA
MDKNSNQDSDLKKDLEPVAPDMTPDPINRDQTEVDTEVSSVDNSEDMSGMDAIINEFIVESYENLDQLDQDLVGLEQNPGEKNILGSIFRTIHTIKGTCGFIGFSKLESVAHVGENLLSKLRDGELTLDPSITSALLAMVDAIRQMLSCIEESQNEGDVDYSELIETLTTLLKGESAGVAPAPAETSSVEAQVETQVETQVEAQVEASEEVAPVTQDEPPAQVLVPEVKSEESPAATPAEPSGGVEKKQEGRGMADTNIRVDVNLLDQLMNLVGELVLARNQILQFNTQGQDATFTATTQHLNLVTTELQEGVMKTRMQPIGNVWSKFPRVVRDLATSCGKKIRLEMEGKETELDKTLIEPIMEPVTNIARNWGYLVFDGQ